MLTGKLLVVNTRRFFLAVSEVLSNSQKSHDRSIDGYPMFFHHEHVRTRLASNDTRTNCFASLFDICHDFHLLIWV